MCILGVYTLYACIPFLTQVIRGEEIFFEENGCADSLIFFILSLSTLHTIIISIHSIHSIHNVSEKR